MARTEIDVEHNPDKRADAGRLPATIAEHLTALDVALALQELVAAANTRRSISSHLVLGDYVAISPRAGGHVSGFFHRNVLSLAMPPRRAEVVGAERGWKVELDSGITSYVRIPSTDLASDAHREAALTLLLEAIDWRAVGPYNPTYGLAGTAGGAQPGKTCPVHFTEMLGGRCDLCDD